MGTRAEEVMKQVNAAFKTEALKLGSDPYFQVEYLPTGCLPVDHLLQGGIPYGRFVEIFGDYSTLKTYVALCAIAQCQKGGRVAALIDTEHSFDPEWAESIGVVLDQLILKQPENGEQAIDVMEVLIRGGVDLIVVDSIAATLPKAEQEKSMQDSMQPARLASLMSAACRKLTAANGKTAVLWINQTRINVGVMFGTNEAIPGGKAMGYYASMRVAFRKSGRQTEDVQVYVTVDGKPTKKTVKQVIGQGIRATLEKSKLNKPHRETMFIFDHRLAAVDNWQYLANLCLDHGLIGYGNGYWWLAKDPKKRSRLTDFRGRIGEDQLREMLIQAGEEHLGGSSAPAKKKAVTRKSASSARVVRGSTRTVGRAGSSTTAATRKRSTK